MKRCVTYITAYPHSRFSTTASPTPELLTKVRQREHYLAEKEPLRNSIGWKHQFSTAFYLNRYSISHKIDPYLVYDHTDALQVVKPYMVNIKEKVTKRMSRMKLLDVLTDEYIPIPKSETTRFLKQRVSSGLVKADGKVIPETKALINFAAIEQQKHRHEMPVLRCTPEQLTPQKHSNMVIVIDKPPSIPCIPQGGYTFNTLQLMLYTQLRIRNKFVLYNDIGKASGLVLLSIHSQSANKLARKSERREIEYTYTACVHGCLSSAVTTLPGSRHDAEIVERQHDANHNTTLIDIITTESNIDNIRSYLGDISHPVLYDWKYTGQLFKPYLNHKFEMCHGGQGRDVLKRFKLIKEFRTFPSFGTPILTEFREQRSFKDYVINFNRLDLSKQLKSYYQDYIDTMAMYDRIKTCPYCMSTRIPLPQRYLAPQIHLQTVHSDSFSLSSHQSLDWM